MAPLAAGLVASVVRKALRMMGMGRSTRNRRWGWEITTYGLGRGFKYIMIIQTKNHLHQYAYNGLNSAIHHFFPIRSRSRSQLSATETSASGARPSRPRVAVVGAGWGGLGAAKALCENGCDVTLLDGGQPGGKMTTPSGKPFEAGTRPPKTCVVAVQKCWKTRVGRFFSNFEV